MSRSDFELLTCIPTATSLVLLAWACQATRPPSQTHALGATAAIGPPPALIENARSEELNEKRGNDGTASAGDPPSADALKSQLAEDGPLHKSIEESDTSAKELVTVAKEFSEVSKGFAEKTKKVLEAADKSHEDLQKAHATVHEGAEAGVNNTLEDARFQTMSSLLSFENSFGPQPETDIHDLMTSLHRNYDKLKDLLLDAVRKANDTKSSAKLWASDPAKEFIEKSQEASKLAHEVTNKLKRGNEEVKMEVTRDVGALLRSGDTAA